MFSFFKTDPVQDIIKQYPHPVDQFILFLREGHTDATQKFVTCYTDIYKQALTNGVKEAEANGKEFGADDSVSIAEKMADKYWSNSDEPRRVQGTDADIKAGEALFDKTYEAYSQAIKVWSKHCSKHNLEGNEEAKQRPAEIIHLQNALKILEPLLSNAQKVIAQPSPGKSA
jgi:hypothetical protein